MKLLENEYYSEDHKNKLIQHNVRNYLIEQGVYEKLIKRIIKRLYIFI